MGLSRARYDVMQAISGICRSDTAKTLPGNISDLLEDNSTCVCCRWSIDSAKTINVTQSSPIKASKHADNL